MKDKIKGCLIGSAIGDGFGYPTEFMNVEEIKLKWGNNGLTEPIGDIIKVTDDTQMAIAVSKAIMNSYEEGNLIRDNFEKELINKFVLWLNDDENNRAPGMTCLKSCENLEKGMKWEEATAKDSKGCGANMRVTPLGILKFKNKNITDTQIGKWSQFQSAITHAHPTALVASELTAIAIIKIIEDVEPTELIDVLIEYSHSQKYMGKSRNL
ncbi:ADP-ribosylglycohydrolase family protein [Bernardetia sp. Wsw4-3y2]|uniref:ADP-ribosylglycohydrolase family protein n=1 Tax=Bernardetia sp. Wsw4-3y2 TaxID=3127471 RepID=UPI0030CC64DD